MVGFRTFAKLALILLVVLATTFAVVSYRSLYLPLNPAQPLVIEVPPGQSARQIIAQIAPQVDGFNADIQYYLARLLGFTDQLQAGVYRLSPEQSMTDLWRQIAAGQSESFQVTLIEGQTWLQWQQALRQAPYLDDNALTELSAEQLAAQIGAADYPSIEGALLPETYTYKPYTKVTVILREAHQALRQTLEQVWQERSANVPYSDPYELLILASIIEKETGQAGERALVASVFVNRIHSGMRLQSDPTTIYGIEDFDGNLTRQHLRTWTPYNTYRIDHLPPTPIAMVSRASLIAAAKPAVSDFYYFVADGQGGHVFSRNLREHNRAVDRYQRQRSN